MQEGITPLMLASLSSNVDAVRALLVAGAKVDRKDKVCDRNAIRTFLIIEMLLYNAARTDCFDVCLHIRVG